MRPYPALAVLIVLAALGSCQTASRNAVLDYLRDAEVQCEGAEQRETIRLALLEMLTLEGRELRSRRYKDYSGKPGQWDAPTLLYRHLVPAAGGRTLGDRFYRDIRSRAVRSRIRELLAGLE